MAFAPLDRLCRGIVLAALAMLSPAPSALAQSSLSPSYWLTVREFDGVDSVPAHLACRPYRRCSGQMSVSIPGGTLRIFVIALIEGHDALVRFRAESRNVACAPHDFVTITLGAPPASGSDYSYLCDAPPTRDEPEPAAEPPVLRSYPALAALRIDVRPRAGE